MKDENRWCQTCEKKAMFYDEDRSAWICEYCGDVIIEDRDEDDYDDQSDDVLY